MAPRSPPARPGEEPPARQSLRSHRSFPLRQENQIKRILPRFTQVPGAPHPFRDAARAILGRIPPAERGRGSYWDGRRMQRALKIHLTSYLEANSRPVSSRLYKHLMLGEASRMRRYPWKSRVQLGTTKKHERNWDCARLRTKPEGGRGETVRGEMEISAGSRNGAPGWGIWERKQ